jgi:hypothetical protein
VTNARTRDAINKRTSGRKSGKLTNVDEIRIDGREGNSAFRAANR